jgi:hypothetical protein
MITLYLPPENFSQHFGEHNHNRFQEQLQKTYGSNTLNTTMGNYLRTGQFYEISFNLSHINIMGIKKQFYIPAYFMWVSDKNEDCS